MSRPTPTASPEARARAREVEGRLADFGFAASPRAFRGFGTEGAASPWQAARLAEALADLGPVFTAFGRYLASRADLLPGEDGLVLSALPDRGRPAPWAAVVERIAGELGAPPLDRFLAFEEEPFAVHLFSQSHRAWLEGGAAVVVRVAPPGMEEEIARDLPLLPLLRRALPAGFPLDEAVAGFRHALADETDLTLAAEALEELARERAGPDGEEQPLAPRVERRLTTSRMLTAEALEGTPLDGAVPGFPTGPAAAYDLARRLVLYWLRQALGGRRLPLVADLVLTPDGRLGIVGGSFAGTHGGTQANLLSYLRATADDDPERVFACLVREIAESPRATPRGDLRKRLCQVVPLHEDRRGGGACLADHLVAHWRLLRECGYRPQVHLEDFYRGLLWVTRAARRLAPAGDLLRDPLREAFEELEWSAGWSQFRQLAEPRRLAEAFEGYLATMAVLPQQVEQAIALLARGEPAAETRPARTPGRSSRDAASAAVALGLVMAGLALGVSRLTRSPGVPGVPGEMIERVGALLFLGLGALFLWCTRGRRR